MFKLFSKSIGRKFSILITLFIVSFLFVVFLSVNFFGKIAQISNLKRVTLEYEVLSERANFQFERYSKSFSGTDFSSLSGTVKRMIWKDEAVGTLYKFLKQGLSVDDSLLRYRSQSGKRPGQRRAAEMINSLIENRYMLNVVRTSNEANRQTIIIQKLINKLKTSDEDSRKRITAEIKKIQKEILPDIVKKYHNDIKNLADFLNTKILRIFTIISVFMIAFISIVSFLILRTITKPLKKTVEQFEAIADGDFTTTLEIKNHDELGVMVNSMNAMSDHLRGMVKDIKKDVETLRDSSDSITSSADIVSESASSNVEKADFVNHASNEMSENMNVVAEAMKTSAENTDSVVTAVEEMTATINEIASNTDKAKKISDQAVSNSKDGQKKMDELNRMADAIGQFTDSIKDISEQTDLLSLNATIEAARAGDAGKGFAVVAGEIKELAKQTSVATKDIQEHIEDIQKTALASSGVIEEIASVIIDVDQIVQTIATALEEQSIVTREIAQNTAIVYQGINEVNEKVSENANVASQITDSVKLVHESADKNSIQSSSMKKKAKELTELSETLGIRMNYFKV